MNLKDIKNRCLKNETTLFIEAQRVGIKPAELKRLIQNKYGGIRHIPMYKNEGVDYLIGLYNSGLSTVEIAKQEKTSTGSIINTLTRAGFQLRSNKTNSRKYNCNHNFFNRIDNEHNAYWLGFLLADGYIQHRKTGDYLGLALKRSDKHHIQLFLDDLDSNYPINEYMTSGEYGENPYARVIIRSDKLTSDLRKLGMVYNKTEKLTFPNIRQDLVRHLIRGYIDGDGSIYITNQGSATLNIVGTDDVLKYISDYFISTELTNKELFLEKRNKHDSVSYIRYGGNIQVKKILSHIYKDATRYLDRKHSVFLKIKG